MPRRAIDFYIKGLPFDVRNDIFLKLNDIGVRAVEHLLEKDEGYPSFQRAKYTEAQIEEQISKSVERFQAVNDIMTANGRYPLFVNPEDTYSSAKEYKNLLMQKTEEELLKKFGCSWAEYVPQKYIPKIKPSDEHIIFG